MILDTIVKDKKRRLVEHKAAVPEKEMKRMALLTEKAFPSAKLWPGTDCPSSENLKRRRQAWGKSL